MWSHESSAPKPKVPIKQTALNGRSGNFGFASTISDSGGSVGEMKL